MPCELPGTESPVKLCGRNHETDYSEYYDDGNGPSRQAIIWGHGDIGWYDLDAQLDSLRSRSALLSLYR